VDKPGEGSGGVVRRRGGRKKRDNIHRHTQTDVDILMHTVQYTDTRLNLPMFSAIALFSSGSLSSSACINGNQRAE
jgi:hypothetical protein